MSVFFVRVVSSALLLGRFLKPNFVSFCMDHHLYFMPELSFLQ